MTPEDQISDARHEQKLLFAERYFTNNKNDAVMIAAKILGEEAVTNPMLAINYGNTWPLDTVVIEEMKRLSEVSKPKGEYIAIGMKWAEICMNRGNEGVAAKLLEIVMKAEGHLANGASTNGKDGDNKGEGHIEDFLEAIVDPENRREDAEQVPAKWQ